MSIALLALLVFFELVCIFLAALKDETNPQKNITVEKCYSEMLEKTFYPKAVEHVPDEIPENAKDALCHIENSFDGYNIDFLKFNTDKKYINYTLDKNKKNILEKINYKKIDSYYKYLSSESEFGIKSDEDYMVYILKNKEKERKYVSGIIAPEKTDGTIVFFYANWDIKAADN